MTRKEQNFLRAFEENSEALFRHCYFRVSDRERALELAQEAFIRGWDYMRGGKDIENVKPFLYKTLHNLIIDEYRKKKTVSLDALLDDAEIPEGSISDLVDDPREAIEAKIDGAALMKMLARMPEQYREVVTLRYVDEFSPKEIAEMLEITENLVSVRIHRGIAWMKKEVAHYE